MIRRVIKLEAGAVPPRHFIPYGKRVTRVRKSQGAYLVKCDIHGELAFLHESANAERVRDRHMLREH